MHITLRIETVCNHSIAQTNETIDLRVTVCLRGYGEFRQDRLELLAAGFLTPLHHLVQESVGLGHDDSSHRRRSGQLY